MSEQKFYRIEIGGTKLQLVRADASLAIQEHLSLEVNKTNEAGGIQHQIEEGLNKIKSNKTVTAIGVWIWWPGNNG